jgi:hypothetical protein
MSTVTSDAAVALIVVAGGVFLGLAAATVLGEITGARPTRRMLVSCVLVAAAAVAFVIWSILGYNAVADWGPVRLQQAATSAAASIKLETRAHEPV